MGELPSHRPTDITVLDMEASIEHLTRGTVRNVDVLLVVTEPYYRSLETAGRTVTLGRELGLERVWVVANKVRTDSEEEAIREFCTRRGLEIIAVVPFDPGVTAADNAGHALLDDAPDSRAVARIGALADTLTARVNLAAPAAR